MIRECSRSFFKERVDPHFHHNYNKLRERKRKRKRKRFLPEVGRRNRERKKRIWYGRQSKKEGGVPIKKERYV